MRDIPSRCPICNDKHQWEEVINPFTRGIPIAGGVIRIRFLSIRGLPSLRKKLGMDTIKYRCGNCGYEETYDPSDRPYRLLYHRR